VVVRWRTKNSAGKRCIDDGVDEGLVEDK
jgi:hypothetical protein